ncbi:Mini-ribonuclease 3 [Linum grandiflorum]
MQTLSMISPSSSSMTAVRASWDTQQRLTYNPNAPRNPNKKKLVTETLSTTTNSTTPSSPPKLTLTPHSVSELLRRNVQGKGVVQDIDDSYLGCDVWLPRPPKVEKPRSAFNAATLAYIGDGIYELYARRHFLFPPLNIDEYNDRVMAVVRCEAQDALLQKLKEDDFLSAEERGILKWGKNVGSAKTRTRRRAGSAVYNRASSLETLIGYLYLKDSNRLDEVMQKLGFSAGSSSEMIVHETSELIPGEQADETGIKGQ